MQCPNCGGILVATATYCNHCNTPVAVQETRKPKRSIFPKFIAVFLFLLAGVSVYYALKPTVCLTGTWQRNFRTDQAGSLVRQEYSFNPFGYMSRDMGTQRERGQYVLKEDEFVFTQTNAYESETIPYVFSHFGKLYLNGEMAYPYTISGLSLSHGLFLVALGCTGLGVYLMFKRPKYRFEDEEEEEEIEYEMYEEEDEEEYQQDPIVNYNPPNPPPMKHQQPQTPSELFGISPAENPYHPAPPTQKVTDSEHFSQAGDL